MGQNADHEVSEDRIDEMNWLWNMETSDPETREWRKELSPQEQKIVDTWDQKFAKGMAEMFRKILETGKAEARNEARPG